MSMNMKLKTCKIQNIQNLKIKMFFYKLKVAKNIIDLVLSLQGILFATQSGPAHLEIRNIISIKLQTFLIRKIIGLAIQNDAKLRVALS